MPFAVAEKVKEAYEPTPEGRYTAICYQIVDLGTQKTTYDGKEKYVPQMVVSFELHGEAAMPDGKPFSVRQRFTTSLSDKARLRAFLQGWSGKPVTDEHRKQATKFIKSFLGKPADMIISHRKYTKNGEERVAEDITSIHPAHPAVPVPKMHNTPLFFDISSYTREDWDALPKWMQDAIANSPEFKEAGFTSDMVVQPTESTAKMTPAARPAKTVIDDNQFDDEIPFAWVIGLVATAFTLFGGVIA